MRLIIEEDDDWAQTAFNLPPGVYNLDLVGFSRKIEARKRDRVEIRGLLDAVEGEFPEAPDSEAPEDFDDVATG